jgi:acetyl esterase/lipase
VGDFGHIFVNGRDISPNRRGYNVAIIQSGNLRTANFDTHLDPTASTALARFITSAPPDALIAVAADDEASANLSEEAVHALQAVGAQGDLRGCFRCSHAFIRMPAGATFETLDALGPAGITSGRGLTEPGPAALVEWIRVEMVE